jgi:selenide, water dikinase
MQADSNLILKDLVLVGGGHSHVEVLKKFAMRPLPGLRITLLAKDLHTPYSGMLPGLVAGLYTFDDAHVDLRPLCQLAGARLIHDEAIGLQTDNKRIICASRPAIEYDILSINVGSRQALRSVPGASEFATAVKPINRFMASWMSIIDRVLAYPGSYRIGVVGAGAAGVEVILSMQRRLQELLAEQGRDIGDLKFFLVSKSSRILSSFHAGVSRRFNRILNERGITVMTGVEAVQAGADRVQLSNGEDLVLDEILWVTEGGAQAWPAGAGLDVDANGFIELHDTLQSTSHPDIFAAGDIGHVAAHPRPKAGVIAVRQGAPLAENLRRALLGQKLKSFKPQKQMLALIGSGDRYAIATRGNWHTEGRWVWRWKDWIDRRWMSKYNDLPEMSDAPPTATALKLAGADELDTVNNSNMRCMGCGAKVSASVLSRVIADLSPLHRPEVVAGIHSADDAALVTAPTGGLMVHSVDHLSAIVNDAYLFGKIAANHALSDIFAMGAEPQTALAILSVPHSTERKVEATVRELMVGAVEVLNAANTSLIGGHTSEASDLTLGFAINGHVATKQVLNKQGMNTGDALILTKPLGVGALFAADMRYKAQGRWIQAALHSMLQSNQQAAAIFSRHQATACTDVTGFGLLGHLLEMCRAARQGVDITLDSLPMLPGVIDVMQQKIYSSLHASNEGHFASEITGAVGIANESQHLNYPLLFDPQTSGGLLATVPATEATACISELIDSGFEQAAVIGRVSDVRPYEPLVSVG